MLRAVVATEEIASSPEWWASAPFVIALAVISVLGVAGTIWFGFAPRRVSKRLRYRYESLLLVPEDIASSGLKMLTPNDRPLERVTVTSIEVGNTGRAAITGSGLAPAAEGDPAELVVDFGDSPPGNIASWLTSTKHDHVLPTVTRSGDILSLTFSVIEPGETFRLDVLHDGPDDVELQVRGKVIDGTFVGGRPAQEFLDFPTAMALELANTTVVGRFSTVLARVLIGASVTAATGSASAATRRSGRDR